MFIRIPGNCFKVKILHLLQEAARVSVNFTLEDDILYLQAADTVIREAAISVSGSDTSDTKSITVNIDQTMQLVLEDQELEIEAKGGLLTIRQENFQFSGTAIPEERVETGVFLVRDSKELNKQEMIVLVNKTKTLDMVAKILTVGVAPIIICEKRAYIYYSNTVLIHDFDFPDSSLAGDMIRKFASVISRANSCRYQFDREQGLVRTSIDEGEAATFSVNRVNQQLVQGIKTAEISLTHLSDVSLSKYTDVMNALVKAYKKNLLELSVCKEGLRLFLDNAGTRFDTGSRSEIMATIKIATAQLHAISYLFGKENQVRILRGGNCICFQSMNSRQKLILSGIIY